MAPRYTPNPARKVIVTLGTFACALFLNLLIDPLVRHESPFVLFLAAVLVSAWHGGLGSGLSSTALTALTGHYLFLAPQFSFIVQDSAQGLRLALFLLEGVLITLHCEAYKRKEDERARSEAVRQQLATVVQRKEDLVKTLSAGFLQENPRIPGFEAAYFYLPSALDDMVGGDFFDFLPFDGIRQGIVLGDVCGKGLSAALYTAKTKHMLQAYALEDPAPHAVLARLNRALCGGEMGDSGRFVSLVYGVLDSVTGEFSYANAGHPPPVLYDPAAHEFRRLEVTGGVIGADDEMVYRSATVTLPPGGVLVFFTDGVTEAVGSDDPYDAEGIIPFIEARAGEGAEAVGRAVFERARRLAARNRSDDMAIIALRRREALAESGQAPRERGRELSV